MKYPTVSRWCSELQERTSARSAEGSDSANQNHSTSLARAISYLAEVERLSLLMPTRLARSSILCFTAPSSSFLNHFISLFPPINFFYPRFFSPSLLSLIFCTSYFFSPPPPQQLLVTHWRGVQPWPLHTCALNSNEYAVSCGTDGKRQMKLE